MILYSNFFCYSHVFFSARYHDYDYDYENFYQIKKLNWKLVHRGNNQSCIFQIHIISLSDEEIQTHVMEKAFLDKEIQTQQLCYRPFLKHRFKPLLCLMIFVKHNYVYVFQYRLRPKLISYVICLSTTDLDPCCMIQAFVEQIQTNYVI